MEYYLKNRRYIGSKTKLLGFISYCLEEDNIEFESFADVFAGTGVVAEYFFKRGKDIIVNDLLYSNYVIYRAVFSNTAYNNEKIERIINIYNELDSSTLEDNYFSDNFSGNYFHIYDAKKIGFIREDIEQLYRLDKINEREYYILVASLIYSLDRVANTVGHYESFLNQEPQLKNFEMHKLSVSDYDSKSAIYNMDANELVRQIEADVFYIDPPYNARQYVNFYHLLENIAEWKKPPVFNKAKKMERSSKMSDYCRANARKVFEDLILNIKGKYIVVSYNNTYSAKSTSSVNSIQYDDMLEILSKRGSVRVHEIDYRFFNSGKTNLDGHKERIFVCKIDK